MSSHNSMDIDLITRDKTINLSRICDILSVGRRPSRKGGGRGFESFYRYKTLTYCLTSKHYGIKSVCYVLIFNLTRFAVLEMDEQKHRDPAMAKGSWR